MTEVMPVGQVRKTCANGLSGMVATAAAKVGERCAATASTTRSHPLIKSQGRPRYGRRRPRGHSSQDQHKERWSNMCSARAVTKRDAAEQNEEDRGDWLNTARC